MRATPASRNERQPVGLDDRLWIVADVRLDCRDDLKAQLIGAGQTLEPFPTDPALLLHSYAAWGEECVLRLRGDFCFAIWDKLKQRLFCARDHFGIKPFYYAATERMFFFSNALNCIRLRPDTSDELNDDAIADFLLFGTNCDFSTTTFRDIRRLPPAHTLTVSAEDLRVRPYWSLPIDGRIRYKRDEEYTEHFRHVMRLAVADRLGDGCTAISLSGGMDSGTIAAVAREAKPDGIRAFTTTCESLTEDREGHFAKETANFLGIPLHLMSADNAQPFECWYDPNFLGPEPVDNPLLVVSRRQFEEAARCSRVLLDGEGADNLMHFELGLYCADLLRRSEWRTLTGAVLGYSWHQRRRWHRVGTQIRRAYQPSQERELPVWIAREFAQRLNLKERMNGSTKPAHPTVPKAHASMSWPGWQTLFETTDPGVTRQCVEIRYPFLDLRMAEFLLAIPPYPWLLKKTIARRAMTGKLPESVLGRPKTGLSSDPTAEAVQKKQTDWASSLDWNSEFSKFVDAEAVKAELNRPDFELGNCGVSMVCLNFWLKSAASIGYKQMAETLNG